MASSYVKRFNIVINGKTTGISLPTILYKMLALKLQTNPLVKHGHTAVRKWLQDTYDAEQCNRDFWISQYLSAQAVKAIASKFGLWIKVKISKRQFSAKPAAQVCH